MDLSRKRKYKSMRELIGDPVLTERQRKVLNMRYFEHKTLQEVSETFGVTRERVRQIEAQALRRIHEKYSEPEKQLFMYME